MKENKIVSSIREIDLSDLRFPLVAVHIRPTDFPKHCIARIFDIDQQTDTIILKETIQEIQEDISKNTNMVFLNRGKEDVESLVGVWI